ncbi:MAG TPA: ribonuclease P protein subunit [Candidatus Nitrosopolaris sp.]|nr:ribonuclease P protein subunit [Candidatus Nitrosopolaris sp.]
MITPKNILSHELIGLSATIITSPQPTFLGLSGTIIFETKNMFTLRTGTGLKKISKLSAEKIRVLLSSSACFIRGPSLIGRPEDRVARTH